MSYVVEKIETSTIEHPFDIKKNAFQTHHPFIWTIGNIELLSRKLFGFFCSVKCPGDIILKNYDLARALRDAGITVISGFHSPIEKDVFHLLLRGFQPIVICPARSVENMRIPKVWKVAIDRGRLLVLSPFEKKHKRITASLCEQRNRMVALLAKEVFIPYAAPGSKSENLCQDVIRSGNQILTFEDKANQSLLKMGAKSIDIRDLIKSI